MYAMQWVAVFVKERKNNISNHNNKHKFLVLGKFSISAWGYVVICSKTYDCYISIDKKVPSIKVKSIFV